AAASAVSGVITDPRTLGAERPATLPERFATWGVGFVTPDGVGDVMRAPNIKPVPLGEPVPATLEAPVLLKLGDKISTDDISPAGAAALMFRSNVPAIAEFCFKYVDAEFVARARAAFTASCVLTSREREILLGGGLLALTRSSAGSARSQPAPSAGHPRTEPGSRHSRP